MRDCVTPERGVGGVTSGALGGLAPWTFVLAAGNAELCGVVSPLCADLGPVCFVQIALGIPLERLLAGV